MTASAGAVSVVGLRQFSTGRTDEYILRMPGISGYQMAGEKPDVFPALRASDHLDPEEIFDGGVWGITLGAAGSV